MSTPPRQLRDVRMPQAVEWGMPILSAISPQSDEIALGRSGPPPNLADLRLKFQQIANRKHATFYACLRGRRSSGTLVPRSGPPINNRPNTLIGSPS